MFRVGQLGIKIFSLGRSAKILVRFVICLVENTMLYDCVSPTSSFFLIVNFLLWCSPRLCFRFSTLHHVHYPSQYSALLSLPVPLTTTFMQMTLSSFSLSNHSTLTRAFLTLVRTSNFRINSNRDLPSSLKCRLTSRRPVCHVIYLVVRMRDVHYRLSLGAKKARRRVKRLQRFANESIFLPSGRRALFRVAVHASTP